MSCIKSIKVHQKFTIGETIFASGHRGIEEYIVRSKPYVKESSFDDDGHQVWVLKIEPVIPHPFVVEEEQLLFLGDEGVIGFAYDNRPCTVAKTLEKAKLQLEWREMWNGRRSAVRKTVASLTGTVNPWRW